MSWFGSNIASVTELNLPTVPHVHEYESKAKLFIPSDGQSLTRPAVVKVFFLHLYSYLVELFRLFLAHTPALAQKSPVASAILHLEPCSPYSLGPVSLHHFSVAHQPSLRSLWTMMKYSISLRFRIQGGG